jgi:hypothetical protein
VCCVDFAFASFYVFTITAMTITELRNIAEGLAKRASRAADRKLDSITRGWVAIERLYSDATATLPKGVGLSLQGEPETWTNIARLACAIVRVCDQIEPRAVPPLDEIYKKQNSN